MTPNVTKEKPVMRVPTNLATRYPRRALALAAAGLIALPMMLTACGSDKSDDAASSGSATATGDAATTANEGDGSDSAGTTTEGGGEGHLTLGVIGNSADQVDPYSEQSSLSGLAVWTQVYDGLTYITHDGGVEMALAESFTPNETLDVWTIKLKAGIKTHGGHDFTADDVIYSFQRMLDEEHPYAAAYHIAMVELDGIKKIDDLTVEIPLSRPYGMFPELMGRERLKMTSQYELDGNPDGTGMFELVSFTPGREATFKRFEDYWGEKPGFTDLTIQFFADQEAVANALRGGQIDVAHSVPMTDAKAFATTDGISLIESESAAHLTLDMNTAMEPFSDDRVREAFRLIINRQLTVDNAYGGYAVVANDINGNNTACAPPDVPQREQDLEGAKQLLAEAGYDESNPLTVELVTDAFNPGMYETAELFAQEAAKIGVIVEPRQLDAATFLDNWLEWQFVINWSGSSYPEMSSSHFLPGGEDNATHFDDPEFNELHEQMEATAVAAEQCQYIEAMQLIEYERGSVIVPVYQIDVTPYRDRVHGLQQDLYNRTSFSYAGVTVD
ncbi:MAG: ABC transporter substrate-binding protein [Bifidobacteriaceae bacterium]|jgi:peptide/nickel transport system substrate-binding protein|nr:ABC transporter substrate-binding protein [Bifidobacteriaceae bacterium]